MRIPQSISGNAARPYGFEGALSMVIGGQSSKPVEVFLRGLLRLPREIVVAIGIGLPNFQDGVVDRSAVAIEDAAGQAQAFALGLWCQQAGDGSAQGEAEVKERSGGLRWNRRQVHRLRFE